jgi:hypothetical protein
MNRLFSALVLGVYLASCAPALLPPAGSAAFGADGRNGRAASEGQTAAKSELPDRAREKRLVEAWESEAIARGMALEQALKEQIPEMIRRNGGLHPAPGFDPESVWGNAAPHTYVYQVSRGLVSHAGQSFYDVRQAGFLFSRVEELTRTETSYISKADLLMPYFMLCFDEEAMQRAAGNSDPDLAEYPLVKAILDKGLKPADYVDFEAYYNLYLRERAGPPGANKITSHHYQTVTLPKYRAEITLEHRDYLWEYELYAADTESLTAPGEARLDREYIAGQGIDFGSEDFEDRLNGYSVRKSAFENVGDILDGYWEALHGEPMFRRAFERAVGSIDAYLAAEGVVAGANLPTYFKVRRSIPVYRCHAPRLAVCGAAQALSYGWLQTPVVAVNLYGGDDCWLDVPRISSAESNKRGISYASFESGRGNGQDGFSGYETPGAYGGHALNGPGRPDRFSMGAFEIHSPEIPKQKAAEAFAGSYYQCNFPYKMFSRAALRGMSAGEAIEAVLKQTGDSIPEYWQDRFHGKRDSRMTPDDALLIMGILLAVADVVTISAAIYEAFFVAEAVAVAAGEAASGGGAFAVSEIAAEVASERSASSVAASEVFEAAAALSSSSSLISSSSSSAALAAEYSTLVGTYGAAYIEYVGPVSQFYRLAGQDVPGNPLMVYIPISASPVRNTFTQPVASAGIYMVPRWMTMATTTPGMRVFISARYRIVLNARRPRATFHVIRRQVPRPAPYQTPGQPTNYYLPEEISITHFTMPVVNPPHIWLPVGYPITRPQYLVQSVLTLQDSLAPTWLGFPYAPLILPFPPLPPP